MFQIFGSNSLKNFNYDPSAKDKGNPLVSSGNLQQKGNNAPSNQTYLTSENGQITNSANTIDKPQANKIQAEQILNEKFYGTGSVINLLA